MLDLREGLRARISQLQDERAELEARLKVLVDEEQSYQLALTTENKRHSGANGARALQAPEESSLRSFVAGALEVKAMTLETIRDEAVRRGLLSESASPGRSVQGVLAGMAKAEMIEKTEHGEWRLIKRVAG